MQTTTATKMTVEEFFDFVHLPENANKWFELDRGGVIEMPPPNVLHGVVCRRMGRYLDQFLDEHGGGYVAGNDSGVILARDPDIVRGPDVAVFADAKVIADVPPKYGEVAPILAVEVLSPNDRAGRVNRKIADYFQAGTKLVWLFDPESFTVIVHRLNGAPQILDITGTLDGEDVIPGFQCKLADIYRLPHEPRSPAATPPHRP